MLTEILFTLGQVEVVGFNLVAPQAGPNAGYLNEIRTTPPKANGDAGKAPPGLGLLVMLVRDGIGVKARGGNIAPGCADTGAGLTLKTEGGAGYKFAELGQCLRYLKAVSPEFKGETAITFTADPGVAYSDVLRALDVARGAKRELFPDVTFGIAR